MRRPAEIWKLRERSFAAACRAARRGEPEGLHDLRVALRRVAATAAALGRKTTSRRARGLARRLSGPRQLEVDRQILARISRLGILSADAAAALAARWEELGASTERRVARIAGGRKAEALLRRLERLSRKEAPRAARRLEKACRRAESVLARPLDGKDDATLHRYRLAVKNARYLAEDLAALGRTQFGANAERQKTLQESLGRWNDLRVFCRRLEAGRGEAEQRGAVSLAAELAHLLAALQPAIATARHRAVEASRQTASVVPITRAVRA